MSSGLLPMMVGGAAGGAPGDVDCGAAGAGAAGAKAGGGALRPPTVTLAQPCAAGMRGLPSYEPAAAAIRLN